MWWEDIAAKIIKTKDRKDRKEETEQSKTVVMDGDDSNQNQWIK